MLAEGPYRLVAISTGFGATQWGSDLGSALMKWSSLRVFICKMGLGVWIMGIGPPASMGSTQSYM